MTEAISLVAHLKFRWSDSEFVAPGAAPTQIFCSDRFFTIITAFHLPRNGKMSAGDITSPIATYIRILGHMQLTVPDSVQTTLTR